jgi:hypothetical protein
MTISDDENQQKAVFKDDAHQENLNKPLGMQGGMSAENKEFLEFIMELIKSGKINLYAPNTLLNDEVYNTLDEKKQGEVDMEAMNTLSALRDIKGLYLAGYTDTYQMQNLVDKLRLTKEKFEEAYGDVFII